jgi:hypothetical protein
MYRVDVFMMELSDMREEECWIEEYCEEKDALKRRDAEEEAIAAVRRR